MTQPLPTSPGRPFLPGLCLTIILAFAATASEDSPLSRAPYLQLSTPHSIHIVWRTSRDTDPLVRFGTAPDRLDQSVPRANILTRVSPRSDENEEDNDEGRKNARPAYPKLHSAPKNTRQYEAHLTGLSVDTRYYYAIYDGETRLTEPGDAFTFQTHPLPGTPKPMRFWLVGDSGTGREDQKAVYDAMRRYIETDGRPLDFYLHVGDMAYNSGKDSEFHDNFFKVYAPTLSQIVCWAAMGNHEGATSRGAQGVGPYYDAYVLPTRGEAGGVPSGMEAYYSFDYGRTHFICLDSHDLSRIPTGAMARWLRLDLARTQADWLIAFWHHPPYTKGSHDSDKERQLIEMRRYIMPILESGGVDLVLTGHSHIYERSMLIDGAYATPTVSENVVLDDGDGDPAGNGAYRKSAGLHPNAGAVQVVSGHGGAKMSRKGTSPIMRKILLEFGSVIIDVNGDTLNAVMLNRSGEERDRFSLVKQGVVTHSRIAFPWQPPAWKPEQRKEEEPVDEPPDEFIAAIPKNAEWNYLAGGEHPPDDSWKNLGFDNDGWQLGEAGFGYGDDDDRTVLDDMRDNYTTVYIRREFTINNADYVSELGLMIRYDDAFIAYLNGKEVMRKGVGEGSGKEARDVASHDAQSFRFYPIQDFAKHIKTGINVIAIEGHNTRASSSDFTLDPYLLIEE